MTHLQTISSIVATAHPGRKILGHSAVLLPITNEGRPDYDGFAHLLNKTFDVGLVPAVNMDTGYVNLLSHAEREEVLRLTQSVAAGRNYIAGAFVQDQYGDPLNLYDVAFDQIQAYGGTPILFQSDALSHLGDRELITLHQQLAVNHPAFFIFELGEMFVPFGRIYPIEVVRELMQIDAIKGMKHSSLRRDLELERLALRLTTRPDFLVLTGNDLAIDMVMYGSDYLLGLSAFHPEAFALRDRLWEHNQAGFFELNDALQYLGAFAFRPPVPAYKHSCAQFLKLREEIDCDTPHSDGMRRPDSDVPILAEILVRIEQAMQVQTSLAPQA